MARIIISMDGGVLLGVHTDARTIYRDLPTYWSRLKKLQRKTPLPMKGPGKSVFDLEERFRLESAQVLMDGFDLAG